jgi:hypothetical protein
MQGGTPHQQEGAVVARTIRSTREGSSSQEVSCKEGVRSQESPSPSGGEITERERKGGLVVCIHLKKSEKKESNGEDGVAAHLTPR